MVKGKEFRDAKSGGRNRRSIRKSQSKSPESNKKGESSKAAENSGDEVVSPSKAKTDQPTAMPNVQKDISDYFKKPPPKKQSRSPAKKAPGPKKSQAAERGAPLRTDDASQSSEEIVVAASSGRRSAAGGKTKSVTAGDGDDDDYDDDGGDSDDSDGSVQPDESNDSDGSDEPDESEASYEPPKPLGGRSSAKDKGRKVENAKRVSFADPDFASDAPDSSPDPHEPEGTVSLQSGKFNRTVARQAGYRDIHLSQVDKLQRIFRILKEPDEGHGVTEALKNSIEALLTKPHAGADRWDVRRRTKTSAHGAWFHVPKLSGPGDPWIETRRQRVITLLNSNTSASVKTYSFSVEDYHIPIDNKDHNIWIPLINNIIAVMNAWPLPLPTKDTGGSAVPKMIVSIAARHTGLNSIHVIPPTWGTKGNSHSGYLCRKYFRFINEVTGQPEVYEVTRKTGCVLSADFVGVPSSAILENVGKTVGKDANGQHVSLLPKSVKEELRGPLIAREALMRFLSWKLDNTLITSKEKLSSLIGHFERIFILSLSRKSPKSENITDAVGAGLFALPSPTGRGTLAIRATKYAVEAMGGKYNAGLIEGIVQLDDGSSKAGQTNITFRTLDITWIFPAMAAARQEYVDTLNVRKAFLLLAEMADSANIQIENGERPTPLCSCSPFERTVTLHYCVGGCLALKLCCQLSQNAEGYFVCEKCLTGKHDLQGTQLVHQLAKGLSQRLQREGKDTTANDCQEQIERMLQGCKTGEYIDAYRGNMKATNNAAVAPHRPSVEAVFPLGWDNELSRPGVHTDDNIIITALPLNLAKYTHLPGVLQEVSNFVKAVEAGGDQVALSKHLLSRCEEMSAISHRHSLFRASRIDEVQNMSQVKLQPRIQEWRTGKLASNASKSSWMKVAKRIVPYMVKNPQSGFTPTEHRAISIITDEIEAKFHVMLPRRNNMPFPFRFVHPPTEWNIGSLWALVHRRYLQMKYECNKHWKMVDTEFTIFLEIVFQACATMDNSGSNEYKEYKELLGLPITPYMRNPLMLSVAHRRHGSQMRTGWPPNARKLADRENEENNIHIETTFTNYLKFSFPERFYAICKEHIRQVQLPDRFYNPDDENDNVAEGEEDIQPEDIPEVSLNFDPSGRFGIRVNSTMTDKLTRDEEHLADDDARNAESGSAGFDSDSANNAPKTTLSNASWRKDGVYLHEFVTVDPRHVSSQVDHDALYRDIGTLLTAWNQAKTVGQAQSEEAYEKYYDAVQKLSKLAPPPGRTGAPRQPRGLSSQKPRGLSSQKSSAKTSTQPRLNISEDNDDLFAAVCGYIEHGLFGGEGMTVQEVVQMTQDNHSHIGVDEQSAQGVLQSLVSGDQLVYDFLSGRYSTPKEKESKEPTEVGSGRVEPHEGQTQAKPKRKDPLSTTRAPNWPQTRQEWMDFALENMPGDIRELKPKPKTIDGWRRNISLSGHAFTLDETRLLINRLTDQGLLIYDPKTMRWGPTPESQRSAPNETVSTNTSGHAGSSTTQRAASSANKGSTNTQPPRSSSKQEARVSTAQHAASAESQQPKSFLNPPETRALQSGQKPKTALQTSEHGRLEFGTDSFRKYVTGEECDPRHTFTLQGIQTYLQGKKGHTFSLDDAQHIATTLTDEGILDYFPRSNTYQFHFEKKWRTPPPGFMEGLFPAAADELTGMSTTEPTRPSQTDTATAHLISNPVPGSAPGGSANLGPRSRTTDRDTSKRGDGGQKTGKKSKLAKQMEKGFIVDSDDEVDPSS